MLSTQHQALRSPPSPPDTRDAVEQAALSGSWPVLNWISQVCPPLTPPRPCRFNRTYRHIKGISLQGSPCTSGSVWTAAKESISVPAEAPGGLASVLTLHAAGLPLCPPPPQQAEWTLCGVTGGGDGGGCSEAAINNKTNYFFLFFSFTKGGWGVVFSTQFYLAACFA